MLTTIPLDRIPHYPSHLSSSQPDTAEAGISAPLRPLEHITADHRAALVDAMLPDLRKWNAPAHALDAARLLGEEGSYAVVTGQQAGIGTGPLYTLYKALGAVRMAAGLERLHPGTRFVPIFWIEADDHDFEEVRKISVIDRSGIARAVAYEDVDARPRHVGDRLATAESFERFLEMLEQTLVSTEFSGSALGASSRCLSGGGGIDPADARRRLRTRLLRHTRRYTTGAGLLAQSRAEAPGRHYAAA